MTTCFCWNAEKHAAAFLAMGRDFRHPLMIIDVITPTIKNVWRIKHETFSPGGG